MSICHISVRSAAIHLRSVVMPVSCPSRTLPPTSSLFTYHSLPIAKPPLLCTPAGYAAAGFFDIWAPHLAMSPQSLYQFYKDADAKGDVERATGRPLREFNACGACLDCLEGSAHAAPSNADSFLHVYSFEPSQYNHALSLLALDHFFPSNGQAASRGQWHITRAAVGACLHLDACCVIVGVAHDHSLVAFSSHAMFYCPVRQ